MKAKNYYTLSYLHPREWRRSERWETWGDEDENSLYWAKSEFDRVAEQIWDCGDDESLYLLKIKEVETEDGTFIVTINIIEEWHPGTEPARVQECSEAAERMRGTMMQRLGGNNRSSYGE